MLAYWRELGWTVHVVGQAVYAHSGNHHLLVGVWSKREPIPAWADRLGRVSPGYERRLERCYDEQAWRRLARDARGRFVGVMPWWSWPQPVLYRWDGQ